MFDYLLRTAPERTKILAQRGLTPNDARALASLEPQQGQTMRALATLWECDPSNATWIVDRLERLALAERQVTPSDRRVKLVVLSAKGLETKTALDEAFYTPPPELGALDEARLEQLVAALEELSAAPNPLA